MPRCCGFFYWRMQKHRHRADSIILNMVPRSACVANSTASDQYRLTVRYLVQVYQSGVAPSLGSLSDTDLDSMLRYVDMSGVCHPTAENHCPTRLCSDCSVPRHFSMPICRNGNQKNAFISRLNSLSQSDSTFCETKVWTFNFLQRTTH